MHVQSDAVAALLRDINGGDTKAFDALVALVYGEVRRMAGSLMRRSVLLLRCEPFFVPVPYVGVEVANATWRQHEG